MDSRTNPSLKKTLRDPRVWALCGMFFLIAGVSLNDVMIYSPDSARYLVWANALSRFEGFVDHTDADPVRYVVHAPLYSVLLAPVAFFAPGNVIAAKAFTVLWGVFLLIMFFHWLSKRVSPGVAFLGGLVLALNPLVILYSTQILSEIPFAIVLVGLVLMLNRFDTGAKQHPSQVAFLLVLLVAAMFVREIGITMVLATVIFLAARKNLRLVIWTLVVPLLFYAAWFVRNEIIVAGVELPPLRNSEVFTTHYFTSQQSSLVSEFFARMQTSLPVYLKSIGSLMFLPQYGTVPYGVVITTDPPYSLIDPLASVLVFLVASLSLGLFFFGIVSSFREDPSTGWVLAFLPLYLFMVLVYPFFDIRFLFPLLILMTYYAVVGGEILVRKLIEMTVVRHVRVIGIVVAAVLMIPNAVWCYAFVRENTSYRISPEAFYATIAGKDPFPNSLTKAMSRVGEWMEAHTDTPSVLVTRWKEITFWLPGYKLVELNGLVPLDEFESYLRDYRVQYLLSSVSVRGIRDYEEQMELSTRFRFRTVYRVANMEVVKVEPPARVSSGIDAGKGSEGDFFAGMDSSTVGAFWQEQLKQRSEYLDGIRALKKDSLEKAKAIFQKLSDETNRLSKALLYLAITYEAEGDFPRARQMLWAVPLVSQAGPLLGHAAYHREIIDLLERANWEIETRVRAELYYTVSVRYWLLGLRTQSLKVLRKSLEADPEFLPSLAFGLFFNLQLDRDDEAKQYLERIRRIDSQHPLAQSFGAVLAYRDSLKGKNSPAREAVYRREMAQAYLRTGIGDSAIDELLRLLAEKPDDMPALSLLANLYESRRKFAPAIRVLRQVLEFDPGNSQARERLQAILDR